MRFRILFISLLLSFSILLSAQFIQKFKWWDLFPAQDLLIQQLGDKTFNHFVSVVKSTDNKTILAYLPVNLVVKIRKPLDVEYQVGWFDPVKNVYTDGSVVDDGLILTVTSPAESDMLLILEASR